MRRDVESLIRERLRTLCTYGVLEHNKTLTQHETNKESPVKVCLPAVQSVFNCFLLCDSALLSSIDSDNKLTAYTAIARVY